MTTYTIIYCAFAKRDPGYAQDEIIGVARDGDDAAIARIIEDFRNQAGDYHRDMEEDDPRRQFGDWPIETESGLILTNDEPEDRSLLFWISGIPGETLFENYKYAIHSERIRGGIDLTDTYHIERDGNSHPFMLEQDS